MQESGSFFKDVGLEEAVGFSQLQPQLQLFHCSLDWCQGKWLLVPGLQKGMGFTYADAGFLDLPWFWLNWSEERPILNRKSRQNSLRCYKYCQLSRRQDKLLWMAHSIRYKPKKEEEKKNPHNVDSVQYFIWLEHNLKLHIYFLIYSFKTQKEIA